MSFRELLSFGQIYEEKALKFYKYNTVERPVGKHPEYDFKLDDKLKVEVKADRSAWKTGNLAIEWNCLGHTTADEWVHFVVGPCYERAYRFKVFELKELIQGCRKIWSGIGNRQLLYLLPYKDLDEYILEENS